MDEPANVRPYVLAALLCDSVISEQGTGKKTIIGTFDKISSAIFPSGYLLAIYVKVSDAEGEYKLRLDYVNVSTNEILFSQEAGTFHPTDRLASSELVIQFALKIESPGEYEFRLYANDEWLCRLGCPIVQTSSLSAGES